MDFASPPRSASPRLALASAIRAAVLLIGAAALVFAGGVALEAMVNDYHRAVMIGIGVAAIMAVSLNLINGITGQFSLGHAGFMAIGAYTGAYFSREIGRPSPLADELVFVLALGLGALAAGLAGLIVGVPSLRLRGDYLAIVTLGFNQIIFSILSNLEIVGGSRGYSGIDAFTTLGWVLVGVVGCIWSIRNLAVSQLGREMKAVRDDEIAAEACGIDTTRVKVLAFAFSAAWAGVAGVLQVHFIQSAHPSSFTFLQSIEYVVMVVLGGLGSITGSALAAVILRSLEEVLREVSGAFWVMGALIVLAAYWNFARGRAQAGLSTSLRAARASWNEIVRALGGPALAALLVLGLWLFAFDWLDARRGSLRTVIYAIILIVLMLLRPQGLLGRAEWSLRALSDRARNRLRDRAEPALSTGRGDSGK